MAGIKAMGAKLAYTISSTEKYIAHLTSLGEIKITNGEIDVTDHDSPGKKKEYIAGEQEYDNVSFAGNIATGDDTFARIWALANAQTVLPMEATYANGEKFVFNAMFANVSMGEQTTDGLMTYSGELKISGAATHVPGGSEVVYSAVTPETGANPAFSGWYEKDGSDYFLTVDTTVQNGKTYYVQTVAASA